MARGGAGGFGCGKRCVRSPLGEPSGQERPRGRRLMRRGLAPAMHAAGASAGRVVAWRAAGRRLRRLAAARGRLTAQV